MKKRRRKRAGRLFILLLAIILSLAVDTRRASAHAFLLRTDPPDGSVLLSAPKQMRLWFSEPLEMDLTTITLQDGDGKTWRLIPHHVNGDPPFIIAYLPDLPPNAYRLNWRTVSDEDLHIISGSIVFGIQQSVSRQGSRQTQNAAPPAEVAFRWIGLLSFAAVIGALINLFFLFPAVKRKIQNEQSLNILSSLRIKIISLAFWCSITAFLSGVFTLWTKSVDIQAAGSTQGLNWQLIVSTVYVKRELVSEGCLIAIALLILYWLKRERATTQHFIHPAKEKIRNILLFSFAILWVLLQAMNSHASAFNDFSPARVIAYAFHLLGAGMWIGGQVALIFFIAPRLRTRSEHHDLARKIYVQFGGIAATGVAVLIVTGLYSGGQQVASLDALLLTAYGQSLIFKSIFVVLTGLIGLWHSSLFHPKVARLLFKIVPQKIVRMIFGKANPSATLRLQLMGGVAIFLLAAFLGATPPARGPEFDPPVQAPAQSAAQSPSLSSMADDLLVNFSIKPNQPGQNFINIGVFDTRRPSPGPIEELVVELIPAGKQDEIQINIPLSESDKAGNYHISTDAIQLSGAWKIAVRVHRAGLEDAVLELPWTVMPSEPIVTNRPVLISSRPLAPLLTMASLILSVLLGGIGIAVILQTKLFHGSDNSAAPASQEMHL